jgi:hypothetical protein
MEGYILTQTQCNHCQMPVMENKGISECVVCPLVMKKAKKRADLRRKGKAILDTFDSDSSPKRKDFKSSSIAIGSKNKIQNYKAQQALSPSSEQRDNSEELIRPTVSSKHDLKGRDESYQIDEEREESNVEEEDDNRLSQSDKGDTSEGPFQSLQEMAVAQDKQDISGFIFNWNHDEADEGVSELLHGNCEMDVEGIYDIIEQDSEEQSGQDDYNSDFSGSEGYEV